MKIAIMQPYLFPYWGYFQLINAVDKFILYDDVNYIKRGWINRNQILVGGRSHLFSLPLRRASQNKEIREIEIDWQSNWPTKFLRKIRISYCKAPYFGQSFKLIEGMLSIEETSISRLIYNVLIVLTEYMGIKTAIMPSSAKYENRHLHGEERILDICEKEQASHYINLMGGTNLYNGETFKSRGVRLEFLKPNGHCYQQFNNDFIPNLSIIDVLMFNSIVHLRPALNYYELI